ncbi:MAG: PD40 domain-containing protein [Cyclobacteriaceae bacterium]|nr:PD40 domain-containing protein [Cyclobacteriaceae bacterium SS2]
MSSIKFFLLLFISVTLLNSCVLNRAEKSYDKKEYNKAVELYKRAATPDNAEINYRIAEAYRKSNRLSESVTYYNTAIKAGYDNPEAHVNFARALKSIEQYDEARKSLNTVLETSVSDSLKRVAQYELDNLESLSKVKSRPNYYRIKNLDDLNTQFAEYSPAYKDGVLYFTSNRDSRSIYVVTGSPFTDIYRVTARGANIDQSSIRPLDRIINYEDVNEGSLAISPDGSSIIFAKGNSGKASGYSEVNLFFTRYRNGQWTEPRPLSINDADSWDSTPALSPEGTTLYFSSNRPGGYGGADIYSAQLDRRGRWVDVRNLGPIINTPGEEVFPFVSQSGKLYFSSNGHPGFGNLDLYVATREYGNITVENLGEPMNSSSDDFALYEFDLTRGFFSSNRPGGKGDDDIYTYVNEDPDLKIVNYYLTGVTVTHDDGGAKIILPNTKVSLLSTDNNEILDEAFTNEDGAFQFRVYPEEQYNLIGEKTDYFTSRKKFSTINRSVDKSELKDFITNVTFNTEVMMERIVIEKPIVLENIYYDLDKASIREDAALVLDSLVTIMNDNPEIYVELGSHTDVRADDDYNMDLSYRRARAAVQYMINNGIDASRITAKGYGESQLVIENATTEEEHQKNRRTEFKVLRYDPGEREEELPPTQEYDEYDRFFEEQ